MFARLATPLRRAGVARRLSGHGASGVGAAHPQEIPVGTVNNIYSYTGTAMGAIMWAWIFWRAKHDLPYALGFKHPWDDHHGGHEGGSHH